MDQSAKPMHKPLKSHSIRQSLAGPYGAGRGAFHESTDRVTEAAAEAQLAPSRSEASRPRPATTFPCSSSLCGSSVNAGRCRNSISRYVCMYICIYIYMCFIVFRMYISPSLSLPLPPSPSLSLPLSVACVCNYIYIDAFTYTDIHTYIYIHIYGDRHEYVC